ncbi:MAG: ArsA family ATPase [Proteobacteria bacterium]|jgi:arsenite-transporting ATPase|nr:ArsA family ATPase [Desulfocapsa sp.]MBU3945906.1 ArsA family ATPase [Pseudomonadota bacterium]MCG2744799.1 ArsA family ATPase [Desulfobacteraceae bacterium]MBU3982041.1 ArsA family ATPase [Pseudomonadota bacterium]MBU4028862.1 ArsA family ATPase [Pseudomonadota bacterium]
MTRIEMFTGKGGVGKTTMSVATALKYAQSGKTLLISTDPSGSLSAIFSQPLDQRVTEVASNLDVVELTRQLVLDLWRAKFGDEIYTVLSSFLPVGREIIDYLEGAPGVEEEFMLDYLLTKSQSNIYQTIIWDTAPTVTTLNLLCIQQLFYTHLTQAQKVYLKVKGVFTGVDPLSLINSWRQLTAQIIDMLQTETTSWVVANPERLPVEQALNIAASLTAFGIKVNGFILNKMLPPELCCTHPFWQAKFEAQQRWRQRMLLLADGQRVKEIPELSVEKMDTGFLAEVSELLGKP